MADVKPGSWVGDTVEEFKKLPTWGKILVGVIVIAVVWFAWYQYRQGRNQTAVAPAGPSSGSLLPSGSSTNNNPGNLGVPIIQPGTQPPTQPTTQPPAQGTAPLPSPTGGTLFPSGSNFFQNSSGFMVQLPGQQTQSVFPGGANPALYWGIPNLFQRNGAWYYAPNNQNQAFPVVAGQGQQFTISSGVPVPSTYRGSGGMSTDSFMQNPVLYLFNAIPHKTSAGLMQ